MRDDLRRAASAATQEALTSLLDGAKQEVIAVEREVTISEFEKYWGESGILLVSGLHSENTIYPSYHDNYVARAWHDMTHLRSGNIETDFASELAVAVAQQQQLERMYVGTNVCMAIEADTIGMALYHQYWGQFPQNQEAFCDGYIARGIAAIGEHI